MSRFARLASLGLILSTAASAVAAPTPGYPEQVLQWQVQAGETCEDIASSLYGSAKHTPLLLRYNDIRCGQGLRLPPGTVLVVPETVTELPPASLHSTTPTVKARPPAGDWANAVPGMPLYQEYSVNTLEAARADIRFRDRTRIYLAEHTLVVIYETATASAVSKQRPPAVELQEGEVQAGLAALAGRTVDVTTAGGGRVSAASRDSVLRRRGERTTVSVFDGSAQVASAGKTVAVPKNFGSSFVQAKPPTPPRPLPPAPEWLAPTSQGVLLAERDAGSLRASWAEVPKAVRYRFEVARDAAFTEVIVREETPADVRSFRAEHMPAGAYYLRVRAIDVEDFLGIASLQRDSSIVEAVADGGSVTSSEIRATPYSSLQLSRADGLEVSLDEHDFFKAPPRLDLSKQRPRHVRVRLRGSETFNQLDVTYAPVVAHIDPVRLTASGEVRVRVKLEGVGGIDVVDRVRPRLFVVSGGQKRELALHTLPQPLALFNADYQQAEGSINQLVVLDGRGALLGASSFAAPAQAPPRTEKLPQIGLTSPAALLAPGFDVPWWSPSLPKQATLGLGAQLKDEPAVGQAVARASGGVGRLGLNASLALNAFGPDQPSDSAAWLGVAYRFAESQRTLWALSLRAGLPMQRDGLSTRLEPSLAVGSELGRFSWLGNLGGRVSVGPDDALPRLQAFALLGGTYQPEPWLRLYSLIDGHVLDQADEARARAGLGLGLEAGGTFFGGLSLHSSPWSDAGGFFFGQVLVGIRER